MLATIELWMLAPVAILSAAGGFIAAYLIFGRRRPEPSAAYEEEGAPVPEMAGGDTARFLSDDDRIVRMLQESGGQMYQSDLVKKTSFSKSKISMALTDMCDRGVIVKVKKGKENLIKLNRPPER